MPGACSEPDHAFTPSPGVRRAREEGPFAGAKKKRGPIFDPRHFSVHGTPETDGHLASRTDSTMIVPLPTNPSAVAVPVSTLVELLMRACSETVWTPTGT